MSARVSRTPLQLQVEGFTLIEMLVAVTLIALLSVLLFGAMRLGTRSTEIATAMIDRSGQISLAYNAIRSQLATAEAIPESEVNPPPVDFSGRLQDLRFVERSPAYLGPGGLGRAHLWFERRDGSGRLLLSWSPVGGRPFGESGPHVLLEHMTDVEFSYFGSLTPDVPPKWLPSWESIDHLPTLVRLHPMFADREQFPDLIVALRLAQPIEPKP